MTIQPFSLAFNVAVQYMSELVLPCGYDVAFDGSAPDTLDKLVDHIERHRRILVDGRNSENTIFACAETNYAFRAWHDWTHWILRAPFNLDGELAVAHRQCEDITRVFGHRGTDVALFRDLLMCEVYGQALHYATQGEFPVDQRAFTYAWFRTRARSLEAFALRPAVVA